MTTAIAQIKTDVFSLATELAGETLETVKDLKKWCERNLKELPANFDLRVNKTWELLSRCLETHAYRMEVERRQDEALAEWEEVEQTEVEGEWVEVEVIKETEDEGLWITTEVVSTVEVEVDVPMAIAAGVTPSALASKILDLFLLSDGEIPAGDIPQEVIDTAIALTKADQAKAAAPVTLDPGVIFGSAIPTKEVLKAQRRAFNGQMSANALRRRFASLGLR